MKSFKFIKWLVLPFMLIALSTSLCAQTYHLTAVTSVEAGKMYVFVESGNALINTTASNGRLNSNSSYSDSDLDGDEAYVWLLESATGGYKLKNLGLATNQYLRNTSSSGANLGFGGSSDDRNVWSFSFGVTYATIACVANDRVIGNNGSDYYKAYQDPDDGYSFVVYRLDVDASYTVTWMSNGSQVRQDTDVPSGTAKTPPTISPLPCGDKLMGWTDAAGGEYVHGTSNLYTGATISITGDKTFYAVFADEVAP